MSHPEQDKKPERKPPEQSHPDEKPPVVDERSQQVMAELMREQMRQLGLG